MSDLKIDHFRYESFGGIISSQDPPFLAWIDREMAANLGYSSSPLWNLSRTWLSAPTEVHLAVTNRCNRRCRSCYMESGRLSAGEMNTDQLKSCLRNLCEMSVFHVALGGGEAFLRSDFGEVVRFCREIGLVPNLTTSGQDITGSAIEICRMMGQVNVSLDGVNGAFDVNGRDGDFETADLAIRALVKAGVQTGINCVVSSRNFDMLDTVISYAASRDLNEVEFLKFKPSGRGAHDYSQFALSQSQIRTFYPRIREFAENDKLELKIDCSFVPAMVYHKPPAEQLEQLAVTGCDGGNMLCSVRSDGTFAGCSFVTNAEPAEKLDTLWHTSPHLAKFRMLEKSIGKPCCDCGYLHICKGGCRAVALHFSKDFFAPDPECPIVYDYFQTNTASGSNGSAT